MKRAKTALNVILREGDVWLLTMNVDCSNRRKGSNNRCLLPQEAAERKPTLATGGWEGSYDSEQKVS